MYGRSYAPVMTLPNSGCGGGPQGLAFGHADAYNAALQASRESRNSSFAAGTILAKSR